MTKILFLIFGFRRPSPDAVEAQAMRRKETAAQKTNNRKNAFVIVCRDGVPVISLQMQGKDLNAKSREMATSRADTRTQTEGTNVMDAARYLPFLGRLLIGLPFALSGFGKLAAYGKTTALIAAVGLPVPPLAYAVAVVVEFGGGLLLVAGYQVRLAAIALALFSIAAAASFHDNFADQNQMIHFLKDVMITGGLLQITAFGAGAFGVDNRLSKGRQTVSSVAPVR